MEILNLCEQPTQRASHCQLTRSRIFLPTALLSEALDRAERSGTEWRLPLYSRVEAKQAHSYPHVLRFTHLPS